MVIVFVKIYQWPLAIKIQYNAASFPSETVEWMINIIGDVNSLERILKEYKYDIVESQWLSR